MKKTVLKLSPAPIKKNQTLELLQEIQNRAYSNMGTLYNIDEIAAHFEHRFNGPEFLQLPKNREEIRTESRLKKLAQALQRVEKILKPHAEYIGADCLPETERGEK